MRSQILPTYLDINRYKTIKQYIMTIEEIFSKEQAKDIIAELKNGREVPAPDVDAAKKALNPDLHDVNNPLIRKDKRVKVDVDEDSGDKVIEVSGGESTMRIEKVARIRLAIQKLIIRRAVSFLFGNNVAYNSDAESEQEKAVMKAFNRMLRDVKIGTIDRQVGRTIFGFKECAEIWFPVEVAGGASSRYGFASKYKLRCAVLSPEKGNDLYPYFDETGDMIAFSRSYSRKDSSGKSIDYFETYTNSQQFLWWNAGGNGYEIVEGYPKMLSIHKIPIVYGRQDKFETEDVDSLVDRLEVLLSNFADTNDYHAAPKIFIKGELKGFSRKGESGAIIEGEDDADAKYLSWQNAPESVKLEIETILRLIYTLTQTPDISFDSVKGLGAISGIALKLLFMDAHLKVQDKREVFDDYLQRRANIIKAYIGVFNKSLSAVCEEMDIEPEITPYMLTSEIDELNYWMTANGNKPVLSQEESVEKVGVSKNPKETYEKLKEEERRSNSFVIGEPVDA